MKLLMDYDCDMELSCPVRLSKGERVIKAKQGGMNARLGRMVFSQREETESRPSGLRGFDLRVIGWTEKSLRGWGIC